MPSTLAPSTDKIFVERIYIPGVLRSTEFFIRCRCCLRKTAADAHLLLDGDIDIRIRETCGCNPKAIQEELSWRAQETLQR